MTLPAALTAVLDKNEQVLWHSPSAPGKLSDFGGPHELIARLFFALSAVMALIFFLGMQNAGRMGLSALLLICVGGPIIVGLIIRYVGRHRARSKSAPAHYAVTSARVLALRAGQLDQFALAADTTLAVLGPQVALPEGGALKAEAAIAQAKANQ